MFLDIIFLNFILEKALMDIMKLEKMIMIF